MSNESQQFRGLDEILSTLHDLLEDDGTADDVNRLADEHPEFRREILAFAAEWLTVPGCELEDDAPTGTVTVREHHLLLERFWNPQPEAEQDLFAALSAEELEQLATRCRIDTAILRKLSRRLINETTVPGKLVHCLAGGVGHPAPAVYAFLSAAPVGAGADYFAPSGRKVAGKISFAEAVRTSTLDAEQKRYWLPDLEA